MLNKNRYVQIVNEIKKEHIKWGDYIIPRRYVFLSNDNLARVFDEHGYGLNIIFTLNFNEIRYVDIDNPVFHNVNLMAKLDKHWYYTGHCGEYGLQTNFTTPHWVKVLLPIIVIIFLIDLFYILYNHIKKRKLRSSERF